MNAPTLGTYIKARVRHRRHSDDYINAMLDVVTIDDWQAITCAAVDAAKNGDNSARAWISNYILGKPDSTAPSALEAMVSRLSGNDRLVEEIARPHWEQYQLRLTRWRSQSEKSFVQKPRKNSHRLLKPPDLKTRLALHLDSLEACVSRTQNLGAKHADPKRSLDSWRFTCAAR